MEPCEWKGRPCSSLTGLFGPWSRWNRTTRRENRRTTDSGPWKRTGNRSNFLNSFFDLRNPNLPRRGGRGGQSPPSSHPRDRRLSWNRTRPRTGPQNRHRTGPGRRWPSQVESEPRNKRPRNNLDCSSK